MIMPSIRDLARARVVVVGDAVQDIWIHGRVERISPEAPVPVFLEDRREERAGGAANVMSNLRALGCVAGGRFRPVRDRPIKLRYMVNNQQIFRSDLEDCSAIDQTTESAIFLDATSHDRDVLILSDYAKGVLYATKKLAPTVRIKTALAASEQHNGGVRGPFKVVSL